MGLVQGDGETQSLPILLLLQQVGQLLLPTHKHTNTRTSLVHRGYSLQHDWGGGGGVPYWLQLAHFISMTQCEHARMCANVTEQTRKCLSDIITLSES